MADVLEFGSGEGRVRIEGLGKTMRALTRAGADAEDMRSLMNAIGMIVVNAANPPTVSGALAATIRAGRGKTKAVVRAGGARVPYAGVIHYGWPARNIPATNFLSDALAAERGAVFDALREGLDELIKKNDLD